VSRIRVLVVDDSVVARRIVMQALANDPQIEVVGTAANGRIALAMVKELAPDVVTMDMEMPVMDGIDAVPAMRRRGDRCRIIMFTAVSVRDAKRTFAALAAGANDYVTKPSGVISGSASIADVAESLIPKLKALMAQAGSATTQRAAVAAPAGRSPDVIRLAARPQAPGRSPPRAARDVAGRPHDSPGGPFGQLVSASVDTLFRSAVRVYGGDLLAVVLTGMGSDGLAGCEAVVEAGGRVLAQDEASSLVWGMPGAVVKAGFAHQVLPLDQIGAAIVAEVQRSTLDLASSPGGQ